MMVDKRIEELEEKLDARFESLKKMGHANEQLEMSLFYTGLLANIGKNFCDDLSKEELCALFKGIGAINVATISVLSEENDGTED